MDHPRTPSNESTPKTRRRFGTLFLVAGVLIVEAAAFVGFMTFSGGPEAAHAGGALDVVATDPDRAVVETLVLDARLQNNRSGVTYVCDTEIWVQVRGRHLGAVEQEISRLNNEIRAEINATWKASEPRHLREPGLETVTRKIYALLSDRFGHDLETGEPVILKCVIVAGTGFRADA
ncbi:MAG: DEK C-terminal domain-containing protein [Planctomycetota bacterium]|nr:DEK C-terminal domain-containing protein [Planctomycetota bacterium]